MSDTTGRQVLLAGIVIASLLGLSGVASFLMDLLVNMITAPLKIIIFATDVIGALSALPTPFNIVSILAFLLLLGAVTSGIAYIVFKIGVSAYYDIVY